MKKYLVLYYSKTGNSKFIAEKLAAELAANTKKIIPVIDSVFILFLLSLFGIGIPINVSDKDLTGYDEIIIIGPIWGGKLVSPLRTVIKKCLKASKRIQFAVTCETKDEDKQTKYGYSQVLEKAIKVGGGAVKITEAFPAALANTDNKSVSPKLEEKIKITEENYTGPLMMRVKTFALKIKSAKATINDGAISYPQYQY